jgi:hypothetical protein
VGAYQPTWWRRRKRLAKVWRAIDDWQFEHTLIVFVACCSVIIASGLAWVTGNGRMFWLLLEIPFAAFVAEGLVRLSVRRFAHTFTELGRESDQPTLLCIVPESGRVSDDAA